MPKFSLVKAIDQRVVEFAKSTDHKVLAVWAIDCAKRVLPYFEDQFPNDNRPRVALETLQKWIDTGVFKMAVIRKASLDSHAAARESGEDNATRSAARACGQAVATAHVKSHSIGSAIYSLQAIYRANIFQDYEAKIAAEREWQYQDLMRLSKNTTQPNKKEVSN